MKRKVLLTASFIIIICIGLYFVKQVITLNNEVLDAFEKMEDEFEKSNSIHKINMDSLNTVFNSTIDNYKVVHLNKISKELYNHIDSLKSELLPYFKYPTDDKKIVNQLFFNSNGYTSIGQ